MISYPYPCLSDVDLVCDVCGCPFVFSISDQVFYNEKRFSVPPKRCKPCRERSKKLREQFDNEREFVNLMERSDIATRSDANGRIVNRNSGDKINAIDSLYMDRNIQIFDLSPEEVSIAMRYYGSIEEYLICEKDDPIHRL